MLYVKGEGNMSNISQKHLSISIFFLQRLPYPEYYLLLLSTITITYNWIHYQMPFEKSYPGYFCYSLQTRNYIKLKWMKNIALCLI